ncbi:MAG: transposase [Spirochaetes bacterium]|nr:transposase [Spirochaetota bacterium]
MSWPPRIIEANKTYHAYSRCVNLKKLLKNSKAKAIFLEELDKTMKKYNFELNFYEILDDHFHLVLKTLENEATISKIMQRFKSGVARRLNRLLNRKGPFWNERYGSKIVEYQEKPRHYFFTLVWYIAYNQARKLKISKRKNYNPRNYPFCSINHYLKDNYQGNIKITIHNFFQELGESFEECVYFFLPYENHYLKYYGIN